jgi:hypothetical protein
MKKIYSFLAVVLFASIVASCSSDSSSTNNNGGGGGTAPEGKMIVTINGKVDTLQPVTAVKNGNTYNVGAGNGESVTITTNGITATGNYTNAISPSGQIIAISYGNGSGSNYTATVTIGTANLNISQLSPNFIASFSGTLQLQSGTGASTMTIANGSVNGVVK